MKTMLVIFILTICSLLFSQETYTIEDSLITLLTADCLSVLQQYNELSLQVSADNLTEDIVWLLKKELLLKKVRVTESSGNNTIKANIQYKLERNKTKSGKFIFRKTVREKIHKFSLELTDSEGTLLAIETFTYVTIDKERGETESRWYDPILITAITGGLIYLFYYGSN